MWFVRFHSSLLSGHTQLQLYIAVFLSKCRLIFWISLQLTDDSCTSSSFTRTLSLFFMCFDYLCQWPGSDFNTSVRASDSKADVWTPARVQTLPVPNRLWNPDPLFVFVSVRIQILCTIACIRLFFCMLFFLSGSFFFACMCVTVQRTVQCVGGVW